MSSLFGKILVVPTRHKGGRFTPGLSITAVITTRCNLHCVDKNGKNYCPMFIGRKLVPKYNECSADEWIRFFKEDMYNWVSYVSISGGEPSIHNGLGDIVNYLTARETNVIIYTNLFRIENILKCKPSKRLNILATYHHCDKDVDRWLQSVERLRLERYRYQIEEIELPLQVKGTFHKGLYGNSAIKAFNWLHVAPDAPRTLRLFCGCEKLYAEGRQ